MRHKETLRLFLREYFELFFPNLVPHMKFETADFKDKELYALFVKEEQEDMERRSDTLILIEIIINGGPEWILIHREHQDRRETNFEERIAALFLLKRNRANMKD